MSDVVIIGAGISGLSCAWTLRSLGIGATVLESSGQVGGVIHSEKWNGYLIEWGPNSILPTEESFRIIEGSGAAADLVEADPHAPRFIYLNGALRKAPFGVLSWSGLARMLGEPFVRTRSEKDESVADFFKRRAGREAHDRLVAPFMTGVYAGDTANLSVSAVMPRLVELERRFGSLTAGMLRSRKKGSRKRMRSCSFVDGMETLPRRLAEGLDIRFDVKNARVGDAPVTVLALPAYRAAGMVPQNPQLARLFENVDYAPMLIATTSLPDTGFQKPLRGFGFLVPRSEGLHLLGTLFSSALFPGRAPDGRTLLTSFVGGAFERDAVEWTDDRVWEIVCSELQSVLMISVRPEPVKLIRHRKAIPQYNIGHGRWLGSLRHELQSMPGLFVAANYVEGVSVAACIEQGDRAARDVAAYLRVRK